MRPDLRKIKRFLPLAVILLFIITIGGVFLSRSPVLIVEDLSFKNLYGPYRLNKKKPLLSVALFRRVISVTVAESAGPSLVALSAEAASGRPFAVLFPLRYLEGAKEYKANHDIPVYIMGGRNPKPPGIDELVYVGTDMFKDLYRAGIAAAVLAGENRIIFISEGILPETYREAFREGLISREYPDNPVYVSALQDYSTFNDVGCIVITDPAGRFFERNLKIPIILFSWIDPDITPQSVNLIFDDSPWAILTRVLKTQIPPEGEMYIASEFFLRLKSEAKKDFRNINRLIKAEL